MYTRPMAASIPATATATAPAQTMNDRVNEALECVHQGQPLNAVLRAAGWEMCRFRDAQGEFTAFAPPAEWIDGEWISGEEAADVARKMRAA